MRSMNTFFPQLTHTQQPDRPVATKYRGVDRNPFLRNACFPGSREKLQVMGSPERLVFSSMATIASEKPHLIVETSEAARSGPGYALTTLPTPPAQPTSNKATTARP